MVYQSGLQHLHQHQMVGLAPSVGSLTTSGSSLTSHLTNQPPICVQMCTHTWEKSLYELVL